MSHHGGNDKATYVAIFLVIAIICIFGGCAGQVTDFPSTLNPDNISKIPQMSQQNP